MASEYTRGPWWASYKRGIDSPDRSEWGYAEVVAGEEDVILRADRGELEDIANVTIAAASLDMLEALEMVRDADNDRIEDGGERIPWILRAKIDRAIAKARKEHHHD